MENNIGLDLKEMECVCLYWTHLVQNGALENTATKLSVLWRMCEIFWLYERSLVSGGGPLYEVVYFEVSAKTELSIEFHRAGLRSGNILYYYSVGAPFESRPRHWLSWQIFHVFPQTRTGKCRSRPLPFKLIIYRTTYFSTPHSPICWQRQ